MNYSEMLFNRDEKIIKIIEEKDKEIEKYQLELEKADSITQSCIFQGKQESEISFRNCLNKMTKYKTTLDKIKEIIKDNTNYLFKAEKIYVKCEDELLKSTALQLINNDLVKNDKIFKLLEEIDV